MKIIECPRDAMQGISDFIPTSKKVEYINSLLKIGFHTIDMGSFVSPKSIPQLADTSDVLKSIDLTNTLSKLLVIVANERGAKEAVNYEQISYLGFPFSISETFQKRNINSSIKDSLVRLENIQNLCVKNNKKLVTYFSMAFGNPYGDEWSAYIVAHWSEKLLNDFGVDILSLSDTIGSSNKDSIEWIFNKLIKEFPAVEFGAHLHTTPQSWEEKVSSAVKSGCRRFDGAMLGKGGCPMAKDDLTGNMPTENIITYLKASGLDLSLNEQALSNSIELAKQIF
jgi:hydroxymethylglutaryl-CoA lyase